MAVPATHDLQARISAVRRFNRFYTQRIGVLQGGWAASPFSLTEARVLYEIRQRAGATATDIARELGLDAGYLSRMLRRFQKLGLIRRKISPEDARRSFLSLTERGHKAFAPIEARTQREVAAMLARLNGARQDDLVGALRTVETLLAEQPEIAPQVILREPKPGDLGWVVARHGVLYAQEYGWGENFEGLCAQIVADFVARFDPKRERCWIAEIEGQNVGSIFLVKETDEVARLRLLLVEPSARGLGIGKRLTDECVHFARERGYRSVTLWTHSVLTAARHIYQGAGFRLTSSEAKRSFGQDVVSEYWDLAL
jgi:DNA-binding MarR family transcriptional regulator/GNAT superfamily N-acetyltransferase